MGNHRPYRDRSAWASWGGEVSRREDAAGFNPREAFFEGQDLRDFPPLARVAEIGKVPSLQTAKTRHVAIICGKVPCSADCVLDRS